MASQAPPPPEPRSPAHSREGPRSPAHSREGLPAHYVDVKEITAVLTPAPAIAAFIREPCRCLALCLVLFACEIIFLLIFSGLFYHTLAQDALYHLYADFALAKVCLSLGFFLLLLLLLLDVEGWHKRQCLAPIGKYVQPLAYFSVRSPARRATAAGSGGLPCRAVRTPCLPLAGGGALRARRLPLGGALPRVPAGRVHRPLPVRRVRGQADPLRRVPRGRQGGEGGAAEQRAGALAHHDSNDQK